jgi:acetoin utilization deacetylase AcuC-like enzyme
MIFVSAGFDAHKADDMSSVSLTDDDYHWVTEQIMQLASTHANGRVVSSLEGGMNYGAWQEASNCMCER